MLDCIELFDKTKSEKKVDAIVNLDQDEQATLKKQKT